MWCQSSANLYCVPHCTTESYLAPHFRLSRHILLVCIVHHFIIKINFFSIVSLYILNSVYCNDFIRTKKISTSKLFLTNSSIMDCELNGIIDFFVNFFRYQLSRQLLLLLPPVFHCKNAYFINQINMNLNQIVFFCSLAETERYNLTYRLQIPDKTSFYHILFYK